MRLLKIVLLNLIFSSLAVSAQTFVEDYKFLGKFDFENPNERILAFKFFDDERLQLIGPNTFQIWDAANNRVLESRHHDIENLTVQSFGGTNPEQNKILVIGGADVEKKLFPTAVWNAETGKRLAVLDAKSARRVVSGAWSKNGKTLVTASNASLKSAAVYNHEKETEICFWDGETLALRGSIFIDDLTWLYLSDDGERLFATSVAAKKGLFGIPFVNGMARIIRIWNARTAKNEENLSVGDDDFATLSWKLSPSPDGRYFALVSKSKIEDAGHRVLVWEIGGASETPKYTIKANPKVRESRLAYSPDGKFFALDAGRSVQVYELETGRFKYELNDFNLPQYWLADNRTWLYNSADKVKAFALPDGRPLFTERVAYETTDVVTGSTTDANGNYKEETTTEVVDYTRLAPHPNGKFFIAYSNQSVKIYDSRTGANVRTLISPPPVIVKKRKLFGIPLPKTYDKGENLVKEAGWFADGKTIFAVDAQGKAVSLWTPKN